MTNNSNTRKSTTRELVAAKRASASPSTASTPAASAPAPRASTAVAVPDNRSYRARYLDEVAPSGIAGRLIKFDKSGKFVTTDDGSEIDEGAEFAALCDQTVVGWQRFNGPGEPPDKVMGLLYDGFVMPPREALGDADPAQWEEGLAGEPQDPWQHAQLLVLQDTRTSELFTFATRSTTGRRAVGTLLKHYDRMQKTNPGELPVIRLRTGGFQHKDARVGFVITPVFVVVGRQSRDSVAKPIGGYLNDEIPFEGGGEDA